MVRLHRLAFLFNIRPGEGRLVLILLAQFFFLGLGFVLTQTASFALFLATFSAAQLPLAYLGAAVSVSLVTLIYLRLAERLLLSRLLVVNITFLLVTSAVLYLSVWSSGASWLIFFLPPWFQMLVNLGNIALWSLASRLLDVRQGKRLFGLIGAGNWLSFILGGSLARLAAPTVGVVHLLGIASASLVMALIIQRVTLRVYADQLQRPTEARESQTPVRSEPLWRSRYILLILALVLLWWVGFYFNDNIYYSLAEARYPQASDLASFLGAVTALTGVVAFSITTFGAGPLLRRYGLHVGLLTMPVILTLGATVLVVSGSVGVPLAVLTLVAAFNKLINVALGFSLEQSSRVILYQPLAPSLRVRAQATAEGIVQPLAVGLAGGLLLIFNTWLGFGPIQLTYLFLVVAALWLPVVFFLLREYRVALIQAITRRRLGEAGVVAPDYATLLHVRDSLTSPYPDAVFYALDIIEDNDPGSLPAALSTALLHPSPAVRQEALARIERLRLADLTDQVRAVAETDAHAVVRGQAVRVLAAVDPGAFDYIYNCLQAPNVAIQAGAIVGLLRSGRIEGVAAASETLLALANAALPTERVRAAEIIGMTRVDDFNASLLRLLGDESLAVRRAALLAAGQVRQAALWPAVMEALADRATRPQATYALISGGDSSLPALEAACRQADLSEDAHLALVRAAGRIGGLRATALLLSQLDNPSANVRTSVLNALSGLGYRATSETTPLVQQQLRAEMAFGAQLLAAQSDIGESAPVGLLREALRYDLSLTRDRLLLLLSLMYDPKPILEARQALSRSPEQRAYALEVVDTLLSRDLKPVLHLLEDSTVEHQLRALGGTGPDERLGRDQRLAAIARADSVYPVWTRACALNAIGQLDSQAMRAQRDVVMQVATEASPLLEETARWALARLNGAVDEEEPGMLSTIEKVVILKTVGIFEGTPDAVLADVASLLEEVDVAAGESVFDMGDYGDSMYIIVSGQLRVHNGDQILNVIGPREVFGEMALLDNEPRMASVTALEDAHLFRLNQEPFFELMADHSGVARGIIRVLSRRLRRQVDENQQLHSRVVALEDNLVGKPT